MDDPAACDSADGSAGTPLRWRMPLGLRLGVSAAGVVALVAGIGLIATTPGAYSAVLGVLVALCPIVVVIPAWRGQIAVDGDTLTVSVGMSTTRRIQRDEITRIETSDSGVYIEYLHEGRRRDVLAEAAQGVLNPLGAKVLRQTSRSQQITDRLTAWWRGPYNTG